MSLAVVPAAATAAIPGLMFAVSGGTNHTVAAPMARIHVHGRGLYAGTVPWRAWGFNWGAGSHAPVIAYFDDPTPQALTVLSAELRTARSMGANSMRIYLELGQVMQSPTRARPRTLAALSKLLAVAERERIYLEITGNLVWRPDRVPSWYERLSERERWNVQVNFWRAVAGASAGSPAVLCYELTSEPVVSEQSRHYLGDLDGWTFVQRIAAPRGRDPRSIARAWTGALAAAVRSRDERPVTIGLLPVLHDGFTPANVADLVDMFVVHEFPQTGSAPESIARVRAFAAFKKPVLLGETFMIEDDRPTQRDFLLGASRYIVGVFEFFDGRDPNKMPVRTISDAVYQVSLRQFMSLRSALLTSAE